MPACAVMTTVTILTILGQPSFAEHVDDALPDRRLGGLERRRDAERDHQRPHGAAMGDRHRVGKQGFEPFPHPQRDAGVAFARGCRDAPFVPVAGSEACNYSFASEISGASGRFMPTT